jgi:aldose 1-epimerase
MRLSGDQIEIVSGPQRLVVASVGATLRAYSVGEREVIDGFDADQVSPSGRGQILIPWPNRIAGGHYSAGGHHYQLPINEPELGHAIHGLIRWAEWRVEHRTGDAVRLHHRLCAQPGYPFQLDLSVEYRLSPSGLAVAYRATNIGSASCPFGVGQHPYFALGGVRADEALLCVPAKTYLEVDARSIPRRSCPVERTSLDFRKPRVIGAAHLDHAFTALERDPAGIAHVALGTGRSEVRIWQDRAFEFVQVYTGDTLPDGTRRRRGMAIEPMSCAPNAFNSGDGLRVLDSGESFEGQWGVTVSG